MSRIIVTLTDRMNSFEYDVEVPTDLIYEELVDDIAQTIMAYNPSLIFKTMKTSLIIPKLGMKKMNQGETLDQIGVLNGDYVIIE